MPAKASTGRALQRGERLRIRLEPAVEHRQALRARGRDARSPAGARADHQQRLRRGASWLSSGARSGPAGNTVPLPMPRRPSTTRIERSLCSAGFWKPSSITIDAGAGRARGVRAGDAVARHDGRREPRQQQRLVADVGRAVTRRIDPHRARRARRHSRG